MNSEGPTEDLPPAPSLRKAAVGGAVWTMVTYGLAQVLRFGANLVLTRLLAPELFGLMALLNIFLMGLNLFSDLGIGPSIVRSSRGDDPDFLNTAWTLQVIRGVGLWVLSLIIAFPVSALYGNPSLLWLVPLLSLSAVFSGFSATSLYTSSRQLAVRRIVLFELATQVVSLAVMLVWAWLSPTIFALLAGALASAVFHLVGSNFLIPGHRNRFRWDQTAVKELFSFGKWVFLSTALTFLASQTDRLILGKVFSLELLGVFAIAFSLSEVPRQVVQALSSKVLFPALSQLAHLPRPEIRRRLLKPRRWLLFAAAAGLSFLAVFGDLAIRLLYDHRYDQAAWMLPLLALGIWPNVLSQTLDPALFAVGKPQWVALGNTLRLVFNIVGIPLAFFFYGVPGAVICVALNDVPFYLAVAIGVGKEGLTGYWQEIQATLLFAVCIEVLLLIRWFLHLGLPISGMLG